MPGPAENGDDDATGEDGVASAESGGADVTSDGEAAVGVGVLVLATYAATEGGKGGIGDGGGAGDGRGPATPGSGGG